MAPPASNGIPYMQFVRFKVAEGCRMKGYPAEDADDAAALGGEIMNAGSFIPEKGREKDERFLH